MKLEDSGRRKTVSRRGAATTLSSNYDSLFVHRKNALYRRAAELSAITDCNVGIILLSPEGELSQFSTAPMKKMLRSYAKLCSMPHEIHTMESIQAKCVAAGGSGIGLRVDQEVGALGSSGEQHEHAHFRDDTLRLSSESQGKRGPRVKGGATGQGPWEADALEAILTMGDGKRKLEVGVGSDDSDDQGDDQGGDQGGDREDVEAVGSRAAKMVRL